MSAYSLPVRKNDKELPSSDIKRMLDLEYGNSPSQTNVCGLEPGKSDLEGWD